MGTLKNVSAHPSLRVVCIPPHMLGDTWGVVGPWLLKGALAVTGEMNASLAALAKICLEVHEGKRLVWAVFDDKRVVAALETTILMDGNAKWVWASTMAGENIRAWGGPVSDALATFAKAEGCKFVRCTGRKALGRVYNGARMVAPIGKGQYLYERAVQ